MGSQTERQLVAAIVGQGYVGLPLAQAMSRIGITVYGYEISSVVANALNSGRSHVDDVSDQEVQEMLREGYRASSNPAVLREADVVVICVPTPLDDGGGPDLTAVETAGRMIAKNLKPGATIVLESTTYPGTTEELLRPILEGGGARHGEEFFLAYSPERVDPGSQKFGITNTPKLVGGITPEATERATAFYRRFVDTVVPLSGTKEAETAKLLENTYRHVNIALVNEMARFCHDLGIDIWEVIRGAATKPFGFQKFTPGPGVGGHCIPIDPNYLSFQVKRTLGYQFRFVELAQEINNSMPQYVVSRLVDMLNDAGRPLRGTKVLLLGVTYKPNIADQRESPAHPLAEVLREKRAVIAFHDPMVEAWALPSGTLHRVGDLDAALRDADIVVLLQDHDAYDIADIGRKAELVLDTRGAGHGIDGVQCL